MFNLRNLMNKDLKNTIKPIFNYHKNEVLELQH
jgi:hypothetical protein